MNTKLAAYALATAAFVAVSIHHTIKIHKIEAAKRAQIEIDKNNELEAIRKAGEIMRDRIDSGYYDRYILAPGQTILQKLDEDFRFFTIVSR